MIRRQVFLSILLSLALAPFAAAEKPLVILVSIDGGRWDYPELHDATFLQELSADGLRVERLRPCYPSKTFPNHYSLVTGLRPESHGIVQNRFFDPEFQAWFGIGAHPAAREGRWWGGEPIWNTLQRQGGHAFCLFWPGSEADIGGMHPDKRMRYNGNLPYDERVNRVLSWATLPTAQRPELITLYFEGVDSAGHRYGPNAPETHAALQDIDHALTRLRDGLQQNGLWEQTTLIVTADHGMTPISAEREVFLDDLIDLAQVDVIFAGASGGLQVKDGADPVALRDQLRASPHLQAFLRDEVPERLHFSHNDRIPDLVIMPNLGWEVSTKAWKANRTYEDGGDHGFDNAEPDMSALFIAHGPRFRAGQQLPIADNIDVYNLLSALLHVKPAPNEGSDVLVQALQD